MRMRTLPLSIAFFLLFASAAKELRATRLYQEGGIYPNKSVEYVRTLNRFASTDVDAAFFNPAGLVFTKNLGLYVSLNSQTYHVEKKHTMDYYAIKYGTDDWVQTFHSRPDFTGSLPNEYFAVTTAPCLPDFYMAYHGVTNGREWAVYLHAGIMQAAPGMNFPKGIAVIDWGNLAYRETILAPARTDVFNSFSSRPDATRTEYFIGGTVGGVYKILDVLSAALGVRYIYCTGNMDIKVTDITYVVNNTVEKNPDHEWNINTEYQGHGASVIFGLHARPISQIDIGFRFEYHTPITMAKKTNHFKVNSVLEASGSLDVFKDGSPSPDGQAYGHGNGSSAFHLQYPMSLSLGISYRMPKNLRMEVGTEIRLNQPREMDGEENDYDPIGWKLGGCLEWGFMKNVVASVGYLYNDHGIKASARDEADMLLTSHTVGAGLGFAFTDRFDLNIGAYYDFYIPETLYTKTMTNPSGVDTWHAMKKGFKESRWSVGIGLTYRFLGGAAEKPASDKTTMDLNLVQ